jgi:serine/threonine protein phosphatase PrpC
VSDLDLFCPSCGAAYLADDEFCESCGSRLPLHGDRDHAEVDAGTAAAVTDRGLVHTRNEDAFVVAAAAGRAAAVVCDGVSASVAPHLASKAAADAAGAVLRDAIAQPHPGSGADICAAALDAAREAVAEVPTDSVDDMAAPACTFVGTLWDGSEITVMWIGDSRAYWVDNTGAVLLTTDNSWAREQIDAGLLSEAAAVADPRAHAITRWIGRDAVDGDDQIAALRPRRSGRLVLCSDGLWNYAPNAEDLAALIAGQPSGLPPIELARALTRAALAVGGHDNVTVAVVDIVPDDADVSKPKEGS